MRVIIVFISLLTAVQAFRSNGVGGKVLQSCHYHPKSMIRNLIFDQNKDGKISLNEFTEGSSQMMNHSPLITALMRNIKEFVVGQRRTMTIPQLGRELSRMISLTDVLIILALNYAYRPILYSCYRLSQFIERMHDISYEESIFGRIQQPVQYLALFPLFLLLADIASLLLAFLGFEFHLKGKLAQVLSNLGLNFITGWVLTRFKDWLFFRFRRSYWQLKHSNRAASRDLIQEKTTDELTSAILWTIVAGSSLQTLSAQLGVGINSIFALGGLGSASFILALRSTMENLLGGLLLRLQDKFRIQEKITLPTSKEEGWVESIHWLSTKLRRDDDSIISVPNANFIQGEVINWSRTPYRLFKTTITVKESNISLLPEIVENIRRSLFTDLDIETMHRDLIVAATGFSQGNILIEINARLKGNSDTAVSAIKTRVVDKIASVVDLVYRKHNRH